MFWRGLGGEKVSRRHRWVSGVAALGREQVREKGAPEGAAVRGLWGGAVCEGLAQRGDGGSLTSPWSPGPAEGLNSGGGVFLLASLSNCEVVSRCAGLFGECLAVLNCDVYSGAGLVLKECL